VHFCNYWRLTGEAVLIGFVGGKMGAWVTQHDHHEVQGEMLRVLRVMYGPDNVPEPTHLFVTRWEDDAFAGHGSYSYIAVGSSMKDHATLQRPVSARVLLAGEHASEYPGFVHGAYLR
jgi:monoamine oxidase